MRVFLVVALFVYLSFCQNFVDVIMIDSFDDGQNNIIIQIPQNPNFPIVETSIYTDSGNPDGLLGGERDLKLTVQDGPATRLLSTQVIDGEWNTATPNAASGFVLMQWDGKDNSLELDSNGLGGLDFTENGATRIHANIETDINTEYTFTIYDTSGKACAKQVQVPGTQAAADYFIDYTDFSGSCDFKDVGAVEVLIAAFDNVDSIIYFIATNGKVNPTPTATPIPSKSASPSGLNCFCDIPTFECDLDVNGRRFIPGEFGNPPGEVISYSFTSGISSGVDPTNLISGISGGGNGLSGIGFGGNSGASTIVVSSFVLFIVLFIM